MTITSSQYVYATRFQTTAATDIPISYIYGAMPVGFVLMLIHLLFIARGYHHGQPLAHARTHSIASR